MQLIYIYQYSSDHLISETFAFMNVMILVFLEYASLFTFIHLVMVVGGRLYNFWKVPKTLEWLLGPYQEIQVQQFRDLTKTKALDPNYCRQQTLWLHDLCLEVLTLHGTKLHLFGAKSFPHTHTINVAHLI